MRLAPKFTGNVGHCVVLPQVANSTLNSDELNVVWTGTRIWGDHGPDIEISVAGVKEMAKLIGLPSREEHVETLAELESLRKRNAELEHECNRYEEAFSAIDVLESSDFRARRKAGRKPAVKA